MELFLGEREDVTVVTLAGQLDFGTVDALDRLLTDLREAEVNRVVVDLSALTFCDSMGLSSVVQTARYCKGTGGFLRLAGVPPFLLRVLDIVGIRPELPTYRCVDAAVTGDPAGLVR